VDEPKGEIQLRMLATDGRVRYLQNVPFRKVSAPAGCLFVDVEKMDGTTVSFPVWRIVEIRWTKEGQSA